MKGRLKRRKKKNSLRKATKHRKWYTGAGVRVRKRCKGLGDHKEQEEQRTLQPPKEENKPFRKATVFSFSDSSWDGRQRVPEKN